MQDRLHAWLKAQRDQLVNMTRLNRLLHTRTASLEIQAPAPTDVLSRISRGSNDWRFHLPEQDTESPTTSDTRPDELVIVRKDRAQIERALRLLERNTAQAFVDKGLWTRFLEMVRIQCR